MVSIMRITEMYDKDVFTDAGEYFGKVADIVLGKFMISGWVIKSTPTSMLRESLGNVKAVIVPHKAVKAIGDIVIISHNIELSKSVTTGPEEEEMPVEEASQKPEVETQQKPPPFRF